jgi:predicted acetylornithine/succinylornithine family transaminase
MTSHLSSEATVELFQHYVIGNYKRYPVNLVRGEGSRVWDSEGKELLDLFPGWGCNLLGHCHPAITEAVSRQVRELIHVPNTWHIEQQGRWAQMLSERSFQGKAFFCNSGAEANEAAIKLARLHGAPNRYKIITFEGGFHGRTMGALSATAQPKYHLGLGPMLPGFSYVPWGDLEAVSKRIDSETAAIMLEPIQGEGGVRIPSPEFLKGLRDLADQHGLLLILDEVQTGCGRTGHWFGYQYFGVQPDIITLAKSICGGIAGGAMLARSDIAEFLRPGLHASTFGGNPIAAAAGIAFLETVEQEGLLGRAAAIGERFAAGLQSFQRDIDYIREVRVAGVMIGIELEIDGAALVQSSLENGLLINCTQGKVLRLLPALTISDAEIDRSLEILSEVLTTAGNTVASQSA